jgi:hypothetical protein
LNIPTFLAFFTSLGIGFQLSTTLLEKKFLLNLQPGWSGPQVEWAIPAPGCPVCMGRHLELVLIVNFVHTFHYLESLKHVRMCREQTVLCRLKKEARRDEDDLDLEPSRERDSDT